MDNFGTILENIYGQFADNFKSIWGQFSGQYREQVWVQKPKDNLFLFIRNHRVMLWAFLMGVSYI